MKRLAWPLLCFALLAACKDASPAPAPSRSGDEPPAVTLDARGIPLLDGPDGAPRFVIDAAERTAHVIVNAYAAADRPDDIARRPVPPGLRVSLCPIGSIDAAVKITDRCRTDIGMGVREPVPVPDPGGFAIVTRGAAADVLADVVVQYPEGGRAVAVSLPVLRGPAGGTNCSDNGCNPFFELRPTRKGRLKATASWEGPDATLVLLQGNVLGRSQTATGIPYRDAAISSGMSPLAIESEMIAPGEYALALRHAKLRPGEPSLRRIRIDAEWP